MAKTLTRINSKLNEINSAQRSSFTRVNRRDITELIYVEAGNFTSNENCKSTASKNGVSSFDLSGSAMQSAKNSHRRRKRKLRRDEKVVSSDEAQPG